MGVGKLAGFRWIINGRGYANIVPSDKPQSVIYGLIYNLTPADVATLDVNEGVPYAYTKEIMAVEFWSSLNGVSNISRSHWEKSDGAKPGEIINVLVYIDRQGIQDAKAKEEYIYRMNKGIADAVALGVPTDYVEEYIRPFIPPTISEEIQDLAKKQAMGFKEEKDR